MNIFKVIQPYFSHDHQQFFSHNLATCRDLVSTVWLVSVCLCSIVRASTGQSWRSTHHRWSIFLCWTSRCQTLGRATSSLALKWDLSVSKAKTHTHTRIMQRTTHANTHTHTHALRDTFIYTKHTRPVICKLTCKWYETNTHTNPQTHTHADAVVRQTRTHAQVRAWGTQHPPNN